jgi:hypothetical protein
MANLGTHSIAERIEEAKLVRLDPKSKAEIALKFVPLCHNGIRPTRQTKESKPIDFLATKFQDYFANKGRNTATAKLLTTLKDDPTFSNIDLPFESNDCFKCQFGGVFFELKAGIVDDETAAALAAATAEAESAAATAASTTSTATNSASASTVAATAAVATAAIANAIARAIARASVEDLYVQSHVPAPGCRYIPIAAAFPAFSGDPGEHHVGIESVVFDAGWNINPSYTYYLKQAAVKLETVIEDFEQNVEPISDRRARAIAIMDSAKALFAVEERFPIPRHSVGMDVKLETLETVLKHARAIANMDSAKALFAVEERVPIPRHSVGMGDANDEAKKLEEDWQSCQKNRLESYCKLKVAHQFRMERIEHAFDLQNNQILAEDMDLDAVPDEIQTKSQTKSQTKA